MHSAFLIMVSIFHRHIGVDMQNWFPTLNAALESEGLVESFPFGANIGYGETYRYTFDDGSRYGHLVSIYRDERGMYERPVHYKR